ncbi:WD40-repeat-containing domain protein [Cladochytrium replicatum]|nr:WD40-repeat-containing domain protein [Cladochytrium replicatum]
MDFTDLFKQSLGLAKFSPNGCYLAVAVQYRLVIRDVQSLQIVHLFTFSDTIGEIAWADDSDLILCASYTLGIVQVWSLQKPEWNCKIEEGAMGLLSVFWAPDARHVLCFSDFQLRITVWSLLSGEGTYMLHPKSADKGCSFRKDGRYCAIAERKDCKDKIALIDCEDWSLIRKFAVETSDLEDISWSPDGQYIAAWDGPLNSKVLFYHPDGRLAGSFSSTEYALGVKTALWSPSGQFLAVGGYDQKARLLNQCTFQPLIEFTHPALLKRSEITFFREVDMHDPKQNTAAMNPAWQLVALPRYRYELAGAPVTVPSIRPDVEKANPKLGVGICEFNCTGELLVTRNDNMPNCLWIWDISQIRQVAYMQQLTPIKMVAWNPIEPSILAFTCGGPCIYVWGGDSYGCEAFEVPAVNFAVSSFRWNPDGKSLVLMDKDKFCLAFLSPD